MENKLNSTRSGCKEPFCLNQEKKHMISIISFSAFSCIALTIWLTRTLTFVRTRCAFHCHPFNYTAEIKFNLFKRLLDNSKNMSTKNIRSISLKRDTISLANSSNYMEPSPSGITKLLRYEEKRSNSPFLVTTENILKSIDIMRWHDSCIGSIDSRSFGSLKHRICWCF